MTKLVKLLGLDISVIYEPREHSGADNNIGSSNTKLGKIWINNTMPEDIQDEALLHEIIEFIVATCDLDINHAQISTLSAVLHQVLKDNDLFRK